MFYQSNTSAENSSAAAAKRAESNPGRMPRSGSDRSISSFGSQNDSQRIEDLEEQLVLLSHTAATALDRVSELETLLQRQDPSRPAKSSYSHGNESATLMRLESALGAIHSARSELHSSKYYEYL